MTVPGRRGKLLLMLVLGAGLLSGQSPRASRVLIQRTVLNERSLAPDKRKEAEGAAMFLESFVAQKISEKYPCAATVTAGEIGAQLEWERTRVLLGGDEDTTRNKLAGISAAASAEYLIDLSVTANGSGYLLQARLFNTRTGKMELDSVRQIGIDPDAIDDFAQQFADSLGSLSRFSKDKCDLNPWTGTLTYRWENRSGSDRIVGTPAQIFGSGGRIEDSEKYEATVSVAAAGPPKASVSWQMSTRDEELAPPGRGCGGTAKVTTLATGKASGDGAATISVAFRDGKIALGVTFPSIQGEVNTTKKAENFCPNDKQNIWNTLKIDPTPYTKDGQAVQVLERADPNADTQAGTATDSSGGKLTWNLTRTRK